jgi:hypothetical protein
VLCGNNSQSYQSCRKNLLCAPAPLREKLFIRLFLAPRAMGLHVRQVVPEHLLALEDKLGFKRFTL